MKRRRRRKKLVFFITGFLNREIDKKKKMKKRRRKKLFFFYEKYTLLGLFGLKGMPSVFSMVGFYVSISMLHSLVRPKFP